MRDVTIRIPAQLGSLLRGERVARNMTQAQVAAQLGISAQALSKLELDASRTSFDRIHRLCQVLGLELRLGSEPPAPPLKDNW